MFDKTSIIDKFKNSNKLSVLYDDIALTYKKLYEIKEDIILKLSELNIKENDHVGIYLSNPLAFIILYLAFWKDVTRA